MTETMRPYLRVSDDKRGTSDSVPQQLDELSEDADDQGWQLGDAYADEGISASEYGVKVRGDFARLIADLESGAFGATILGIWEVSRFSRQLKEWQSALDALAAARVRVWVSDDRLYDPANRIDRNKLLRSALDAEDESIRTSRRVLRDVRDAARKGSAHGWIPWGYRRIYDPITRELIRQEIVEDEAKVIRTIYRRLIAGDSLRQIAKDIEIEGTRSRAGGVISAQVVRDWATSPTYAGLRRHQPKKHGRRGGALYAAKWPAIIKMQQWESVQKLLSDPKRKTRRDGLGKSMLSFIAKCAICLGPMSTSHREGQGGPHYRCHDRNCVQINRDLLDQVVTERVLLALVQPRWFDFADSEAAATPELRVVRDELADVERQLRELGEAVRHRTLTVALAAAAEPGLLADQARLQAREQELSIPPEILDLARRRLLVAAGWGSMTMAAKRHTIHTLTHQRLLGELRIGRVLTNRWCPLHEKPVPNCVHRVANRIRWAGIVSPVVVEDEDPAN